MHKMLENSHAKIVILWFSLLSRTWQQFLYGDVLSKQKAHYKKHLP